MLVEFINVGVVPSRFVFDSLALLFSGVEFVFHFSLIFQDFYEVVILVRWKT